MNSVVMSPQQARFLLEAAAYQAGAQLAAQAASGAVQQAQVHYEQTLAMVRGMLSVPDGMPLKVDLETATISWEVPDAV